MEHDCLEHHLPDGNDEYGHVGVFQCDGFASLEGSDDGAVDLVGAGLLDMLGVYGV